MVSTPPLTVSTPRVGMSGNSTSGPLPRKRAGVDSGSVRVILPTLTTQPTAQGREGSNLSLGGFLVGEGDSLPRFVAFFACWLPNGSSLVDVCVREQGAGKGNGSAPCARTAPWWRTTPSASSSASLPYFNAQVLISARVHFQDFARA